MTLSHVKRMPHIDYPEDGIHELRTKFSTNISAQNTIKFAGFGHEITFLVLCIIKHNIS